MCIPESVRFRKVRFSSFEFIQFDKEKKLQAKMNAVLYNIIDKIFTPAHVGHRQVYMNGVWNM